MSKTILYLILVNCIATKAKSDSPSSVLNNSVLTVVKDGVTLNCFGIPADLFVNFVENIFTRTTEAQDIRFYFYSRDRTEPVKVPAKTTNLDLSTINFSIKRQTVVIVHGFLSSGSEDWVKNMTKAFLHLDDLNVIVVDWQQGSNTWNYYEASISTKIVGSEIARLLRKIKQDSQAANLSLKNLGILHCVGHSLGAHICAHASYKIQQLQQNDSVKWGVDRISGLDPAQPCFTSADPSLKLDKQDAAYVDVIHSNGRQLLYFGLGLPDQLGNEDFYPNGGQIQIGCNDINISSWRSIVMLPKNIIATAICSHGRSHELYTDSINVKLSGSCKYRGHKWNKKYTNLDDLLKDDCDDSCAQLGIDSINYRNPNQDETYFVPTGDTPHYCEITDIHRSAIKDQLRSDAFMRDPLKELTDRLIG